MDNNSYIFSFDMKQFLLKISFFIAVLLFIVIIGFFLPATPRSSQSLLFAKLKKDTLLKTVPSPRIIFIGGSNLSFGLNSELIQDAFSVHPINTAIHAAIGLQYMLDSILPHIRKGDIVVVSPEYNYFYGDFFYGGEELLRTVADMDVSYMCTMRVPQIKNIIPYVMKYSFSKFKPHEYFGFTTDPVYNINAFNQYGDVDIHWKLKQKQFDAYSEIRGVFNFDTIKVLKVFEAALIKKEASLYITFPGLQASSFDNSIKQINKIESELRNSKFILLGTTKRYRIPNVMMFDTPLHLLKEGVDYRTQLLIEDLKKVLVKQSSVKTND